MKRYFIITVDTEGDDLWHHKQNEPITTENTLFIPSFQELCEKYDFKPVYLTNYEMVCDDRFVDYIRAKVEAGLCEVGLHIHAWNNPPLFNLNSKYDGNPYLIEYPEEVMREKLLYTTNLIRERIGFCPVSHRAGRWAMNNTYFRLLKEMGVKVDCSYTPHVSWNDCPGESIAKGPDYRNVSEKVQTIEGILEVPMSIRQDRLHSAFGALNRGGVRNLLSTIKRPKALWCRPSVSSLADMIYLTDRISREKGVNYMEMMIHSSELMPAGSPYFKDAESIEKLYCHLDLFFQEVCKRGFVGVTLDDYQELVKQ
jgi:hypothetical protein